jgi:hypothetical protein
MLIIFVYLCTLYSGTAKNPWVQKDGQKNGKKRAKPGAKNIWTLEDVLLSLKLSGRFPRVPLRQLVIFLH